MPNDPKELNALMEEIERLRKEPYAQMSTTYMLKCTQAAPRLVERVREYMNACGDLSPDELEKVLDGKLEAAGLSELTDAVSELTQQGQNLDLAEQWQKRAEAAEQRVRELERGLRHIRDAEHPTGRACPDCQAKARALLEGKGQPQ